MFLHKSNIYNAQMNSEVSTSSWPASSRNSLRSTRLFVKSSTACATITRTASSSFCPTDTLSSKVQKVLYFVQIILLCSVNEFFWRGNCKNTFKERLGNAGTWLTSCRRHEYIQKKFTKRISLPFSDHKARCYAHEAERAAASAEDHKLHEWWIFRDCG